MSAGLEIVSLVDLPDDVRADISRIARGARLTVAVGAFDDELRDTYGDVVSRRFLPLRIGTAMSRTRRDEVLAGADVVIVGFPVPVDLRARAPGLRWVHQMQAGASNLTRCDVWRSDVIVTTSRGVGNTVAIAEYVVAAFSHFTRGMHQAVVDRSAGRFDASPYDIVQLAGKTVCVVGAGGIGHHVGRLCAALDMRVVGTRRSSSTPLPGFDDLRGPDALLELLSEASFVAVCCQRTPETEGLIGATALAALPDGAVVVNVARGEIVDERALVDALAAGRLRGVALDVYRDEFERGPPAALLDDPRVVITPHVSSVTDAPSSGPGRLFCQNLAAFVEGRPLQNVIDWRRGY